MLSKVVGGSGDVQPIGRPVTTLLFSRLERGGRQGGPLEMADPQPFNEGVEEWGGVSFEHEEGVLFCVPGELEQSMGSSFSSESSKDRGSAEMGRPESPAAAPL